MRVLYQELIERIRGELTDIEDIVERAQRSWESVEKATSDQDAYLDSVALNLHGFYSGVERLFELIARHVDRLTPEGGNWHRDLLQQMARDIADVRPAVISHDGACSLDEFRRFRHLVRNVYTTNLRPEKMYGLIMALPQIWPKLQAELRAFADFLEDLSPDI